MRKKRIGILGGTFNPVHYGHLILAQDAADAFDLDRVLFVPSAVPPHKDASRVEPAGYRMAMLKRALRGNPLFEVSDIEQRRKGVSYTVDTLHELHALYPKVLFYFIIGEDTIPELHSWRKLPEILGLCKMVTMHRPGSDSRKRNERSLRLPPAQRNLLFRYFFKGHAVDISSTDIRQRVASGKSIRYLVPETVDQYIKRNHLYRNRED